MKRWSCPNGLHPAKLGPERPRMDNACRYCLPCTEKAGKLVPRVCEANEAARAERKAKAVVKQAKTKLKEKTKVVEQWTHKGVDLYAEFVRLTKLKTLKEAGLLRIPPFKLRRSERRKDCASGHAWSAGRMVVTAGVDAPLERVLYVILHELVHVALPSNVHHGRRFWATLREATEEAWGVQVTNFGDFRGQHAKGVALAAAIKSRINPQEGVYCCAAGRTKSAEASLEETASLSSTQSPPSTSKSPVEPL